VLSKEKGSPLPCKTTQPRLWDLTESFPHHLKNKIHLWSVSVNKSDTMTNTEIRLKDKSLCNFIGEVGTRLAKMLEDVAGKK
jgi:hypothetical protein